MFLLCNYHNLNRHKKQAESLLHKRKYLFMIYLGYVVGVFFYSVKEVIPDK